ncbi:uncharacterized protein LOC110713190 [Chenopodium quinoa]|uniref:uncharacterized protein LOC110713190 n=1 Tax=Chenopodium quinoa TaxID=63459 RepID=UPI000B7797A2|nr:uncharacterized protein LOC110713190 [Chenopodium quinoa]
MFQRLADLEKQNSKVLSMMKRMSGVLIPVQREAPDGFAMTLFCELDMARIPRRLSLPKFTSLYDGTTFPEQHVKYYKQRMWQASIPFDCWEACMCKSFGATLTGPALKWLGKLEPGSITSFAMLVNKFYSHFESSRQFDKQTSDLYRIVQGPKETIRTYWSRFNKEKVSIKNVDNITAIEAFLRRLHTNSDPYKDIVKYLCSTFEEVEEILDAPQYPKISKYGFDVNIVAVVKELEPLGSKVRWPMKSNKPESGKDMSKWCEFHSDHGHKTEDCYGLRREVAFKLKRAKRIAKSTVDNADVPEEIRDPLEKKLEAMSITFDDEDINNINKEHEDSLAIADKEVEEINNIQKKANESSTNNEAEYEALIVGMIVAKGLGATALDVYSDSLLIVS